MDKRTETTNVIAQLKGAALRRCLREKKINQTKFARCIKYDSRVTISYWWKGERWPEELEPIMEEVLALPRGFFKHIGEGMPYEEAIRQPSISDLGGSNTSLPEGAFYLGTLGGVMQDCLKAHAALEQLVSKEGEKLRYLNSAICSLGASRNFEQWVKMAREVGSDLLRNQKYSEEKIKEAKRKSAH